MVLHLQVILALKAEALHLADRTSEALEAINEAVALVERSEHRLLDRRTVSAARVFLATMGAEASPN